MGAWGPRVKRDEIHKARTKTYINLSPTHNPQEIKRVIRLLKLSSRDKHRRHISHRGASLKSIPRLIIQVRSIKEKLLKS